MKEAANNVQLENSDNKAPKSGKRIVDDVLDRIEKRKLAGEGLLDWNDHYEAYTEWSRQR